MKKLLTYLSILTLSCSLFLGTQVHAAKDMETQFVTVPKTGKGNKKNTTPTVNAPLYGRLNIPSAGIDVALYNSYEQSVCDAQDSACFFHLNNNPGMTIADHNYQAFRTLTSVAPGAKAVISEANGGKIYLQCVEVYNGHNTASALTDNNGNIVTSTHDFLTYTCLDSTQNIRICQWDILYTENTTPEFEASFQIDARTASRIIALRTSVTAPTTAPDPGPENNVPDNNTPAETTKPGKGNNKKNK